MAFSYRLSCRGGPGPDGFPRPAIPVPRDLEGGRMGPFFFIVAYVRKDSMAFYPLIESDHAPVFILISRMCGALRFPWDCFGPSPV